VISRRNMGFRGKDKFEILNGFAAESGEDGEDLSSREDVFVVDRYQVRADVSTS
jgi:hypothetical protein